LESLFVSVQITMPLSSAMRTRKRQRKREREREERERTSDKYRGTNHFDQSKKVQHTLKKYSHCLKIEIETKKIYMWIVWEF
jgi:hypothetical protein